ncbi:hypothetical protein SAY87_028600 [Trapa incisa]|uniref:BHLH domain-containing protein n=1 Tax=Trapa incisa TaxID=236973 RepID=A0AAN7QQ88_9MYRT|nr:hypothetical protein SAY87_028600 [Trapa incisa]
MESDPFQNLQFRQAHNQQQQEEKTTNNPGLTRYRSAPSSYFTDLLDTDFYHEILHQPSSPETERIPGGLMPRPRDDAGGSQPEHLGPDKFKAEIYQKQPKQEEQPQLSSYPTSASTSQNYCQSSSHVLLPSQSMEYMAAAVSSMGDGSAPTGLVRQSSSPAGLLLGNLNSIEGYGALRVMGSLGTSPREKSYSPATMFGNPMNYLSAGQACSSVHMSPIAEVGNKDAEKSLDSPDGGGFDEGHGNNYDRGYPLGSWDDSSGLNALEAEEMQGSRGSPTSLARHMSLPNSSSEIDRLLQIQDSVPCKIRAKRGFATHPRSIAERVRRTKISERIRKLQDLVPSMDKQTNTAEMLDSAVEYIKDLQEQVKILSDSKSKCVCSNRQMQ